MANGPEGWVAHPQYRAEFERARSVLEGNPARWRVIYHYDGDGIAAASVALRALQRLGYPVHATPFQGVERGRMAELFERTKGPVLVVDTGASWLDLAASHGAPAIVLDHHLYPGSPNAPELPERAAFVNPLNWGVDGMTELSASSLTWLFAVFLDARNWDAAPWGLSGLIADRQHVGGLKGVNRRLVDEAVRRSLLERRHGLALFGPSIGEALERSIDPYVAGLSGRPAAVSDLLRELEIDLERPTTSLSPGQEERLQRALRTQLEHQGTRPEFLAVLEQEDWLVPSLGLTATELSNLQNSTGREGMPGVGVALALGDPEALRTARGAEERWRSGILAGIRRLEDGGVNSLRSVQWFESPDTTLAGTQAGLAMTYLLDYHRPVFVFSRSSDGHHLKVSGRGTLWLVEQGLDLAVACRNAAAVVEGEGGGHRVASGATIPPAARDLFLAEVDRIVGMQIPSVVAEVAQ